VNSFDESNSALELSEDELTLNENEGYEFSFMKNVKLNEEGIKKRKKKKKTKKITEKKQNAVELDAVSCINDCNTIVNSNHFRRIAAYEANTVLK
jgi:hypothetical protein